MDTEWRGEERLIVFCCATVFIFWSHYAMPLSVWRLLFIWLVMTAICFPPRTHQTIKLLLQPNCPRRCLSPIGTCQEVLLFFFFFLRLIGDWLLPWWFRLPANNNAMGRCAGYRPNWSLPLGITHRLRFFFFGMMITSSPEISYIGSDVCCFSSFYTPFLWCEQPSILLSISFILDLIRLFQAPSLHIRQCAIVTQKFDFSRIFFTTEDTLLIVEGQSAGLGPEYSIVNRPALPL